MAHCFLIATFCATLWGVAMIAFAFPNGIFLP